MVPVRRSSGLGCLSILALPLFVLGLALRFVLGFLFGMWLGGRR